jgi:hypothetical protein
LTADMMVLSYTFSTTMQLFSLGQLAAYTTQSLRHAQRFEPLHMGCI